MTISCSFFDHQKYPAQEFLNRDKDFISNGVVNLTDFAASYPGLLVVNLGVGTAWINGYRIGYDASPVIGLTLAAADPTNPRIDLIEVGYKGSGASGLGDIKVVTGVPAASPIQPSPDAGYLGLFAVRVNAGVTSVNGSTTTDLRGLSIVGGNALGQPGGPAKQNDFASHTADDVYITEAPYNADPTGTNNSTAAFEAAIKAVQVTGGKIKIPKGTYLVNINADWTGSRVAQGFLAYTGRDKGISFVLEGAGSGTILKSADGVNPAIILNHAIGDSGQPNYIANFNQNFITLKDFSVDGNGAVYGIKITDCAGIRIDNCSIYNFNSTVGNEKNSGGIYQQGAGMFRYSRLNIRPGTYGTAININAGAGDGEISGCDISGGAIGIYFKDSTGDTKVHDNTIYNQTQYCLKSEGDVSDNAQLNIYGNQFAEAGITCVSINEGAAKAAVALNFHHNTIWVKTYNGAVIYRAQRFNCSDNIFPYTVTGIGSGQYGIKISGSLSGTVGNNRFEKIESGGTALTISGCDDIHVYKNHLNVCVDDNTTTFLEIAGTTNRVEFEDNISYQAGSNYLRLKQSGTNNSFRWINNKFFGGAVISFTDNYREQFDPTGIFSNGGFNLINCSWNLNPLILGTWYIWFDGVGYFRFKNGAPTSQFDGQIFTTYVTAPTTATSTGAVGQMAADTNYVYVCVGTNSWKRAALSTF